MPHTSKRRKTKSIKKQRAKQSVSTQTLPLLQLPQSILALVFSFLPVRNMLIIRRTCQAFYQTAKDNLLWNKIAQNFNITPPKLTEESNDTFIKDNVLKELKEIFAISKPYPQEMIEAVGGAAKLASLPVIPEDATQSPSLNSLKGEKIWRGPKTTPFFVICTTTQYPENNHDDNELFVEHIAPNHFNLIQHNIDSGLGIGRGNLHIKGDGPIYLMACKRLNRLVRSEDCGAFSLTRNANNGELDFYEGPRTTEDGRSAVVLTDQMSADTADDESDNRPTKRLKA